MWWGARDVGFRGFGCFITRTWRDIEGGVGCLMFIESGMCHFVCVVGASVHVLTPNGFMGVPAAFACACTSTAKVVQKQENVGK